MLQLHIAFTLLSYLAFLTACVFGTLFLVQERQLKRKTMGWLFHRLPSLDGLDRINFLAIGIGFVLLSVGTVFGFLGIERLFGRWWTGDPKEVTTVLLWVAYCILWLTRLRATLRGRRVALLSILGFTLVLFTFLGTIQLRSSGHPYTQRPARLDQRSDKQPATDIRAFRVADRWSLVANARCA